MEPAAAVPAVPGAPVVVTVPAYRKVVFGPLALILGVLFLTPFWWAVHRHNWTAPGDGSVGTSVVGYLIAGFLAALMLSSVAFFFRFRVEIWPDRIRKRILFGFAEMRLADARHIIVTPRKVNARGVASEKWLINGTGTTGRRFKVTIDLGLIDSHAGPEMLQEWIRQRPELEPSLFGRTSTRIHPDLGGGAPR